MHDLTHQRRAIVSGAMEAAELARAAGKPVAVMLDGDPPAYATVGPAGEWRNDEHIEHAVKIARTIGRRQGWTVYDYGHGVYVTGDPHGTTRYMIPDTEAARLAIAAGVHCDDDGRID